MPPILHPRGIRVEVGWHSGGRQAIKLKFASTRCWSDFAWISGGCLYDPIGKSGFPWLDYQRYRTFTNITNTM